MRRRRPPVALEPPADRDAPTTFEILPDGSFDLLFVVSEGGDRVVYTGPYTHEFVEYRV